MGEFPLGGRDWTSTSRIVFTVCFWYCYYWLMVSVAWGCHWCQYCKLYETTRVTDWHLYQSILLVIDLDHIYQYLKLYQLTHVTLTLYGFDVSITWFTNFYGHNVESTSVSGSIIANLPMISLAISYGCEIEHGLLENPRFVYIYTYIYIIYT